MWDPLKRNSLVAAAELWPGPLLQTDEVPVFFEVIFGGNRPATDGRQPSFPVLVEDSWGRFITNIQDIKFCTQMPVLLLLLFI
jgi:hypothetical protein